MAFTKTPMDNTEQTKLIPLMNTFETRDPTNLKDVDNVNVIYEPINDPSGEYITLIKREGLTTFTGVLPVSPIYGAYAWGSDYVVVGAFGLIGYNAAGTVLYANPSVSWNDTHIGFTEFLYDNGQQSLIISDGSNYGEINKSTGIFTKVTDPDFPGVHMPYPVFLDGYVFIATAQGDIYNSDLNAPLSWSASNFISVESYPDGMAALGRVGQYIVAFGLSSVQYFYNAGNPTGTPIAPQTTVLKIGFRGGLAQYQETLLFVGYHTNGKSGIFMLDGLNATMISGYPIRRRLVELEQGLNSFTNGHILAINGHYLYTWTDYSTAGAQPLQSVYVLDLETKMWSRFAYQQGDSFYIRTSVVFQWGNSFKTIVSFFGSSSPLVFSPTVYRDNGTSFTVQFRTANVDFGTRRVKFGSRLLFHCDQTTASSLLSVSWTDDDYQTYSTPRTVNVSDVYPVVYALGAFKKRAFRVTYTDNFPMRFTGMEMDYLQGQA